MASKKPIEKSLQTKYSQNFFNYLKRYYKKPNSAQKRDSTLISLIWLTPALALLGIFMFYAIFIVARIAVNGGPEIAFKFSWKHFELVWKNREFQIALKNSLIYSTAVVPLSLIISLIVAKSLTSIMSKRIFNFLQGIFFLPYVTSAMAVAMTFAFIFSPEGVMNTLFALFGLEKRPWLNDANYAIWVLIIYGIWKSLPFNIIMLTTALLKINNQYYQAAAIDGMRKSKQLFKVTVPLVIPMLIYLFTIGLIDSFKIFPLGLYANYIQASTYQIQTVVFWIFQRRMNASYNEAAAASIILMIIILLITIVTRIISKQLSRKYS